MEQLRTADIQLQPRPTGYPIPLVPWQLRIWNAMMKRGTRLSDWTMYDASVRILGSLNVSLLQKSIGLVIQRHESLRTRIVAIDGMPRQHIDRASEYQLQTIDLERLAPSNVEAVAKSVIQVFSNTDRDLSAGPLFETKLVRLSSREHLLLVALDHMFSDVVSIGILSRDIWTSYNQMVLGRSPSLPSLPLQFADYSVWQERTCDIWMTKHEAYWRERLSGAPGIRFPIDDSLRKEGNRDRKIVDFPLGKALSARLRDVARQEGTLLSLVVLAVYVAVIARWCNQRDIVITFMSHGRHGHPELQNMIGLLPQQLFFRVELHREDTFRDLLKRVILECQAAHQHQDYNRVRDLISGCPADFFFNWAPGGCPRSTNDKQASDDGSLKVQPFQVRRSHQDTDPVDDVWYKLTLATRETPNDLLLEVGYWDDLFTPSTIEHFVRCFRLLAEEFVKLPLTSIDHQKLAKIS